MINMSETILKDMFERVYEAGWRGSLDLKDDFVAGLMKEIAVWEETTFESEKAYLGGEIMLASSMSGSITLTGGSPQLIISAS